MAIATSAVALDRPTFIILDASASMAQELGDGTRLDAAKAAVLNVIEVTHDDSPDHRLGLVSFYDGCWVDIVSRAEPLGTQRRFLLLHVEDIETTEWGHTPIANSLEIVSRLPDEDGGNIILVSDGQETCEKERDLCQLARQLNARHVTLKVNLVGLALSKLQKAALSCIPEETGGAFLSADDPESLKDALGFAVRDAVHDGDPRCHDNRGGLIEKWCPE